MANHNVTKPKTEIVISICWELMEIRIVKSHCLHNFLEPKFDECKELYFCFYQTLKSYEQK